MRLESRQQILVHAATPMAEKVSAGGFDIRQRPLQLACPGLCCPLVHENDPGFYSYLLLNAFESILPRGRKSKGSLSVRCRTLYLENKIRKGLALGNEGACVVFVRSKSENAVIECEITDSKTNLRCQTVQLFSANAVRQPQPTGVCRCGVN